MEFEQFAREQTRYLLRAATALTGSSAAGEDLVQDVLVKVHARWAVVRDAREPVAYVRRMLVNEHLSWRRKWARVVPVGHVAELGEPADPGRALDEALADRDEVGAALNRLPARQRAVLVLRYHAGLSDSEIAETLGCAAGTVRGHASRALATLRTHLTDQRELVAPDPVPKGS